MINDRQQHTRVDQRNEALHFATSGDQLAFGERFQPKTRTRREMINDRQQQPAAS
jgi:hypothetical protein